MPNFYTVFVLIKAPGAMQNIEREPVFITQFADPNNCQICYFFCVLVIVKTKVELNSRKYLSNSSNSDNLIN